ncbi:MAG: two pore domain potassium channel family protein [Caldilineaceae bacterium]|nr:two pore domain potassium channel family protein [Caldilineaceae bacterium]
MDLLLRGIAILLVSVILITFLLSMARTTLLNRRRRDPLLSLATRFVHAIVVKLARKRKSDEDVARVTVWYMPLFVLILISIWFSVVLFAFAILYWESAAETTFFDSLISSGSALSTLGFDTPSTPQGQVIAIIEGAFGLMIVIFFFSFIPGYQSTMLARDVRTAWLYERVGPTPTGIDVLLWLYQNMAENEHDDFWASWEDWFRQLRVTHVLAPEVIYTPSSFSNQSWVVCSHALLDAAAFHLAAVDKRSVAAPHLCMKVGASAMREVSATLGFAPDHLPAPPTGLPAPPDGQPTEAQFVAGIEQLKAAGVPVAASDAEAWAQFSGMHAVYGPPLHHIFEQTLTRRYPGLLTTKKSTLPE